MQMTRSSLVALPLIFVASAATAHVGGDVGGFASGFSHPVSGWDHVIAMVAVGIWGAFLGKPALWMLPVIFPLVMAFGGAAGVLGIPLPMVETGIALSGIVLGLLIALCSAAHRVQADRAYNEVVVLLDWHALNALPPAGEIGQRSVSALSAKSLSPDTLELISSIPGAQVCYGEETIGTLLDQGIIQRAWLTTG
ncbi:MAG: HupE/UreJ family protein, partial [Maritimibacter sp.]